MESTLRRMILSDLMNRVNWAVVKVAWALMLIPVYRWIYERWTGYESYYSHGPLVLLISLYFLSRSMWHYLREPVPVVGKRMSEWTWLLFVLGIISYLFFCLMKIYFAIALGVWIVIYSVLRGSLPEREWLRIRFWVWFMILAIPIPMVLTEQLALYLKNFSAILAASLLTRIGIVAKAVGNQIYTPFSYLEIGAPCSGLRSILSLFTLSVLFSYLGRFTFVRATVLVLLSPAVAFIGNVLRVFSLGLVADVYGREVALGTFHDAIGYVIFGVDLFLMWGLFKLLSEEK